MGRRNAIGLDIGTSAVRAAELSFGRHGITLERLGQVAVPAGTVRDGEVVDRDAVAHCIRQLWSATRFSSKTVVMGVANQRVVVRQVDLPRMPLQELRASLPFQVQDFLPMPVEEALLDFHPGQDLEVDGAPLVRGMLVAAARETVLANVRCAEAAGLRPSQVDLTSFAVLRSTGTTSGLGAETEALVDVGARVTNIVVHSQGVPRFVRILLMGGQDITDEVSERLGVPLEQAEEIKQQVGAQVHADASQPGGARRAVEVTTETFVNEIRSSLDYYSGSHPEARVERLVLSGGGSLLHGLADRVASDTRLPVVAGDATSGLRIGSTGLDDTQLARIHPLAAVPVGLALGAGR